MKDSFKIKDSLKHSNLFFLDVDLSRCSILMSEWRDNAIKYEHLISHWIDEIVDRCAISKVPKLLANRGIM